jgi:ankyrin repeat protein
LSSEKGHTEVVRLLLEKGADVHTNNWALRWACYVGHTEIVRLLLGKGADVHADNNYALRRVM